MSARVEPTTTETYGLPPEAARLIAKLHLVDPAVLAQILHRDEVA